MENDTELTIIGFIDTDILRKMSDAFSAMTGMSLMVTDNDGKPILEDSHLTEFCEYTRKSPVGCMRCEECGRFGSQTTLQEGRAAIYTCHAGLVEFAAPITTHGNYVGWFIGGQVLTERLDSVHLSHLAHELDLDPETYQKAARSLKVMRPDLIDKAADFLYNISYILSDIAYGRYMAYQANEELAKASKMKSDFLANMSHEIRTPMNAVIGMAEMALREDLPDTAREYVQQIKSSGRALLTIINDILDFSKIASGKMDISPVEYEPLSIVNDSANIIMTRLEGKNVELILNVRPDLPIRLFGDNIRIKQILINIANNAAKFTKEGKVAITFDYDKLSDDEIMARISVEDTGIGIKKEDSNKLFQSFQQLDSKRNRNIEGTGLGLAISKRLLTLMGGDIQVESEYGKGSAFTFCFPQKVVDPTPSITLEHPERFSVTGLISNPYVLAQLRVDCRALGVECSYVTSAEDFLTYVPLHEDKEHFLFIDYKQFSIEVQTYAKINPNITIVILIDYFDTLKYDLPNLVVVKKPVYALNLALILRHENIQFTYSDSDDVDFDFIAPDAEILVVDDSSVNLTVVEGLLEPMRIKIHTALSGKEAIDKISSARYDIVFMDHMMPELDGVETTRIIRRFHKEYDDVPIIALSANAVSGTREMFLNEGMNDFIAKPIELRMLISKIKQWLPVEKIQRLHSREEAAQAAESQASRKRPNAPIGDLDTRSAIAMLGSEPLFWKILADYYRNIEKKSAFIKELETAGDWAGYTIEVHALKSSSRQIGANALADLAAEMEKAGNARDSALIRQRTDPMLEKYRSYIPVLAPFLQEKEEPDGEKQAVTPEKLQEFLARMKEADDNLDMDLMQEVVSEMGRYRYEDWEQELFSQLKEASEDIDTGACASILSDWAAKKN